MLRLDDLSTHERGLVTFVTATSLLTQDSYKYLHLGAVDT
jgi:hypothetical protein